MCFYSHAARDIDAHCAFTVTTHHLLDNLGRPVPNGVYDEKLGPFDRFSECSTCGLREMFCPGHFGHIELPGVRARVRAGHAAWRSLVCVQ